MQGILYVAVLLIRLPLFLLGVVLWAALILAITPIYLSCFVLLVPGKLLASLVQRQPDILAHFLAGARHDLARVRTDCRELVGWLAMG